MLDHDDQESMLVCAVRYCLGRHTYMVGECASWVRDCWADLSEGTRQVIRRDVAEHLPRESSDIDHNTWADLLRFMDAESGRDPKHDVPIVRVHYNIDSGTLTAHIVDEIPNTLAVYLDDFYRRNAPAFVGFIVTVETINRFEAVIQQELLRLVRANCLYRDPRDPRKWVMDRIP